MPRHTHKHTTQRPDAVEVRAAMDAVLRATSAACTLFSATTMPHVRRRRARRVPSWCMVGIAYVAHCDAYCTRAMQAYLLSVLSSVRSRDTGMLRFCSVVEPSLS